MMTEDAKSLPQAIRNSRKPPCKIVVVVGVISIFTPISLRFALLVLVARFIPFTGISHNNGTWVRVNVYPETRIEEEAAELFLTPERDYSPNGCCKWREISLTQAPGKKSGNNMTLPSPPMDVVWKEYG